MILDLLGRFSYFEQAQYYNAVDLIADCIIDTWALNENRTQIVALSNDPYPDSSQYVVYDLRASLAKKGWNTPKMANQCGKARRYVQQYPFIIVVDEFIGTGDTVISRIQYMHNEIGQSGATQYEIRVCTLAAMDEGKSRIISEGINTYSTITLIKGITDYLTGADLEQAIESMLDLESDLKQEVNGNVLPSFGYGKSEACYARDNGNTPNNVFPLFWWKYQSNGKVRNPLLLRAGW